MEPLFTLIIHYSNGSKDELPFSEYRAVRDTYQHGISYSGGRVRRVEVLDHHGSTRAIWDISWDAISQALGLRS